MRVVAVDAMSIDSRPFRQTVGRFVTGVTVIAIDVDGEIRAMTANSFTSLSLDPPLVLFCLGKETKVGHHIRSAPGFSISILREDQRDLSSYFAGAGRWTRPRRRSRSSSGTAVRGSRAAWPLSDAAPTPSMKAAITGSSSVR